MKVWEFMRKEKVGSEYEAWDYKTNKNIIWKLNLKSTSNTIELTRTIYNHIEPITSYYELEEIMNLDFIEVGEKINWEKVEVDTPILVKTMEWGKWKRRYFAKYESGSVYAWDDGMDSFTANNDSKSISRWEYAKLFRE